jgi:hypothetical protein
MTKPHQALRMAGGEADALGPPSEAPISSTRRLPTLKRHEPLFWLSHVDHNYCGSRRAVERETGTQNCFHLRRCCGAWLAIWWERDRRRARMPKPEY